MSKLVGVLLCLVVPASWAFAQDPYWASPTGAALWANCQSATPLTGVAACDLDTANTNLSPGDTVTLRAGTYDTNIQPATSGTAGNRITYQAHTGETPIISHAANIAGIFFSGIDYIVVDGVTVSDVYRLMQITDGSDFNEIRNSTLTLGSDIGNSGIALFDNVAPIVANTHNWIHHNTVSKAGFVNPATCDDSSSLMIVGAPFVDNISDNNTIENNTFFHGGHHVLAVHTRFNVIRNNHMHNEGWLDNLGNPPCTFCADASDKFGNRVLTTPDTNGLLNGSFNLIENNRFGHAGLPSDGNGGDNMTLGSDGNIARHNVIFNAMELGIYFRTSGQSSNDNHVYNNTIYLSGQAPPCRDAPGVQRRGIRVQAGATDNVLYNNIVYNNPVDITDSGTNTTLANNWVTTDGDPLFINPDVTDPASATLPDLSVQSGSGVIDAGRHLTQAVGAGVDSTTLVVGDALFFQDGTRGASIATLLADTIAVGTVSNTVQISSIDYGTNTITLASPRTWNDSDSIWLYQDSSGTRVLHGDAPDIGAAELVPSGNLRGLGLTGGFALQ